MDYKPRYLYRVQCEHSYTLYSDEEGFEARAHYMTPDWFYINKPMIQQHLRCQAMGPRLSPFISLFDNQLEAINRAQFLRNQGYQQVFVAEIHARLQPDTVTIEVGDQTNTIVDLPIWHTQQRDIFIPMSSLTTALHVELDINTESEWLALDYIPRNLIKEIYVPDALGEFRLRSMMMMGVVPIAATIPRPMQQPLPQILPRGVGERGAEMRRGSRLQWMESAAHRGRGPPSRLM